MLTSTLNATLNNELWEHLKLYFIFVIDVLEHKMKPFQTKSIFGSYVPPTKRRTHNSYTLTNEKRCIHLHLYVSPQNQTVITRQTIIQFKIRYAGIIFN